MAEEMVRIEWRKRWRELHVVEMMERCVVEVMEKIA